MSAGFSLDQMVAQHLLWRLARRHQFVFAMMAAHAPYHSSLHLELEQQWSLVRRYIFGKDFGQADFDVNSVLQKPEGEYKEAVLRKITASAIKEYKDTLETYKTETGKDWCISAKHPAADSLIPDSDLLQEYYQLKSVKAARDPRFATIRSEAIDTAMHTTKIHSCVMQRMCMDAPGHKMCTLCQAVLTQKHATMPDWSPSRILAPLKGNGYHMYIPELISIDAPSSVAAEGIPDSKPAVPNKELLARHIDTDGKSVAKESSPDGNLRKRKAKQAPRGFVAVAEARRPCKTHTDDYHSYKTLIQMIERGGIQRLCAIPVNKNSLRDNVFMCAYRTCRYVARTDAELKRHMTLCHEEGDIRCWLRTRRNYY